jgi:hypothetical protein
MLHGYHLVRANYAEVGSATDPYNVFNTFNIGAPFNSTAVASHSSALANGSLYLKDKKVMNLD